MDDEDFDYKIKWFFDRVEQQELEEANKSVASIPAYTEGDLSIDNGQKCMGVDQDNSFIRSCSSRNPIDSDSHSTNEDSTSNDEKSLLGKRLRKPTIEITEEIEDCERASVEEDEERLARGRVGYKRPRACSHVVGTSATAPGENNKSSQD